MNEGNYGLCICKEQGRVGILESLNCQEVTALCAIDLSLRTNSNYIELLTLISELLVSDFLSCK